MILGEDKNLGKTVQIIDVPKIDSQRFSISDNDIIELSKSALLIEKHYGRPMDIEW